MFFLGERNDQSRYMLVNFFLLQSGGTFPMLSPRLKNGGRVSSVPHRSTPVLPFIINTYLWIVVRDGAPQSAAVRADFLILQIGGNDLNHTQCDPVQHARQIISLARNFIAHKNVKHVAIRQLCYRVMPRGRGKSWVSLPVILFVLIITLSSTRWTPSWSVL